MQARAHLLRGVSALSFFLVAIPILHPSEIQPSLLYGNLPLVFEHNQGQSDPQVEFLSRGRNFSLFFTGNEAVLVLACADRARAKSETFDGCAEAGASTVRLSWNGKQQRAIGERELSGKVNYLIGRDPANWRTNITTFRRVRYQNAYPGIDLVFYGSQGTLEYDFVLKPGADPQKIALSFEGVRSLRIAPNGDLVLQVNGGELRQDQPLVYQLINGRRSEVGGKYIIRAGNEVGFEIAKYDPRHTLVIDPVLSYSTYVGGSRSEFGNSIAVDSSGRAYITGPTTSTNFPTKNARQAQLRGPSDTFVTKLWANGGGLIYSTYLGGSGSETGTGIAVDRSGNAYVVGDTDSTDFPTTGSAFQTTNRGGRDAFILKLSPSGSSLVYSTYLGGGSADFAGGMALDSSHRVYLTGNTSSFDFPLVDAMQGSYQGSTDAFVTRLNATGTALSYSTYLGGTGGDYGFDVAVGANSQAYVTGLTALGNFPTTPFAFQRTLKGSQDAFVTSVSSAGGLVYSTLLGGTHSDSGYAIAVDSSRRAYVTGIAFSSDFPVTPGAFQRSSGGNGDAFVTRLNSSGTGLSYSTYLRGIAGGSAGHSITVNSSNHAHVTGVTNSPAFPTKGAFQTKLRGKSDGFLTKLWATGGGLHYSTYFGGQQWDQGRAVRLDSAGNAYVTGETYSSDFPTTPGAFRRSLGGPAETTTDAFVLKVKP